MKSEVNMSDADVMDVAASAAGENDFYEMAIGAMEELAEDKTVAPRQRRGQLIKLREMLSALIDDLESPDEVDEP